MDNQFVTPRLVRLKQQLTDGPLMSTRGRPGEDMWANMWAYAVGALAGEPGRLPARRWADGFRRFLTETTPVVFPDELIVGAMRLRQPTGDEQAEFESACTAGRALPPRTIDGHYGIDHDLLLREGLLGVRQRIDVRLESLSTVRGEECGQRQFLEAARDCLDAALAFADRLADAVDTEARKTTATGRRGELLEIAEICRRVPRGPARSFHEALQSIWTVHLLCRVENGLCAGRFDRTLLPYYRRDLAEGMIDEARASELIGAFLIKYNQFGTWPQGMILGGLDANGADTTNELTYLFLQSQCELRLLNPATGIGWNRHTPTRLIKLAVDYQCGGCTFPAIFNDEVIVPSLVAAGVPLAEAVNYLNSTCVEITVQGASGIRVVANYISFPQILLRALHGGRDVTKAGIDGPATLPADELRSFDALLAAVKQQFSWALAENARQVNRGVQGHPWAKNYPFSSCFVHDCLERGRDWSAGGPRYNFCYPQLVGLANVVDSLVAIRELVFTRKSLTLAEFVAIVDANFADHEPLRRQLVNEMPKYGTDDERADEIARELVEFYYEEVRHENSRTDDSGQFYPGFLCWIQHARLGELAPATPDGRLAHTAFADSIAAVQGRARSGPTAEAASVSKLDFHGALGGMVYNLVLNRSMYDTADGRAKLRALLHTYFERGGFQVQISVVDREMLEQAREDPENHADLMVKVGGYSDYFVRLSPELQDALIAKNQ